VNRFRIAVVGSGAIGSYYGGKLAAAGRDVHFLMRGDLSEIRRDGLRIRGEDEDLHVADVHAYNSTKEIGPCDLVLIAVKTTANPALVDLLPPLLHQTTALMTMQNGLGNEEFLAGHFGAERVMGGLCFISLNRVSPTLVERYDYGLVSIGEFDRAPQSRTKEIAAEFEQSGIRCRVVDNLALERWRKVVWNIPFNGLSIVAGGVDTAAILSDDGLREEAIALMHEVIEAANRCGYSLPVETAAQQIESTESIRPYKPSTLQDFEAGKPLEVEAIWGEPLRRALAAGAKVPRLEKMYSLLKDLAGRRERSTIPNGSDHR
jgi:2-dehydropantoate 2-reductase